MKLRELLSQLFVGLPGGALIFMGTLMFNALLGKLIPSSQDNPWTLLLLLSLCAFIVGLLARLARPYHGMGSALASGLVAAAILLGLRLASAPGSQSGLVFGPLGMLAAIGFALLGGWLLPRLWKRRTTVAVR